MTDSGQFGTSTSPAGGSSSGQLNCIAFEEWLAESVENILPPGVPSHLSAHVETCLACNEKLALARTGYNWLVMLKQEPLESPANIVAKILARTERNFQSVPIAENVTESMPANASVWQRNSGVLRRTLLEPRLAMVAAMAFFSISLTLNLLGVRLTGLRPTDLTPRNMRRTITRQYAQTNARVVRYYENLPIVYEVEVRMEQLRRAAETSAPSNQQETKPPKQSSDLMAMPRMNAALLAPFGIPVRQEKSFA